MAVGLQRRNQRQSPRIDVLLRVKGELVPLDFAITIVNMSQTGFALISDVRFRSGDRLDFRLSALKGRNAPSVDVTATAVHSEFLPGTAGRFLTGFSFQPDRATGTVPGEAIRELIATAAPAGVKV